RCKAGRERRARRERPRRTAERQSPAVADPLDDASLELGWSEPEVGPGVGEGGALGSSVSLDGGGSVVGSGSGSVVVVGSGPEVGSGRVVVGSGSGREGRSSREEDCGGRSGFSCVVVTRVGVPSGPMLIEVVTVGEGRPGRSDRKSGRGGKGGRARWAP